MTDDELLRVLDDLRTRGRTPRLREIVEHVQDDDIDDVERQLDRLSREGKVWQVVWWFGDPPTDDELEYAYFVRRSDPNVDIGVTRDVPPSA